jgi:transposase
MVAEIAGEHESEWAAMGRGAELLGVGTAETVRKWVRQAEIDAGARVGTSSEESAELRRLRRENTELKRANAILKAASAFFAGRARPAFPLIAEFIRSHADRRQAGGPRWGVEPICRVLTEHLGMRIAPSTLNRPGSGGGSQPREDESRGSTEEVQR